MAASEGFLGWLKGLDEGYRNGLADNVTRLTNQVPITASRGAVIDESLHEVLANRLVAEAGQEGLDAARLADIKAELAEQGLNLPLTDDVTQFRETSPAEMSDLIGEALFDVPEEERPGAAQRRAIHDYAQNGPGGPTVLPGTWQRPRENLVGLLGTRAGAYGIPAALVGAPVALSMLTSDDGARIAG